jgi:2-dehydro-3-deoxyphosphogluconate aldolase / (4S)-4-hydroxy-2-oxoglutarate aldolase
VLETLLRRARVIPVIALDNVDDAVPLAGTLATAGLGLIEITLRTPAALPAVRAIRAAGVAIDIAIGTVRTVDDMRAAEAAGAVAMISPGTTPALVAAARDATVPWLPGVNTASEVMMLTAAGYAVLKLFPSRLEWVDALAGPFPDVRLVPTGGVNADNAADYLARANVIAVSGSWIAPRRLIAERAWDEIGRRARTAAAFATGR